MPEIAVFLLVYLAITFNQVDAGNVLARSQNVTWDMIYMIVILSGIGGVKAFSIALDKGELVREMVASGSSRIRFLLRKFFSLYLLTLLLVFLADVAVLVVFMEYYFSPEVYSSALGTAPLVTWGVAVAEQMMLLFFLCSLIAFLSFASKSTAVSLLVFLAITIIGISFYRISLPTWAGYLQLGSGDYSIVNRVSQYLFFALFQSGNRVELAEYAANAQLLLGVAYRLVGGAVLLLAALVRFNRMDLE